MRRITNRSIISPLLLSNFKQYKDLRLEQKHMIRLPYSTITSSFLITRLHSSWKVIQNGSPPSSSSIKVEPLEPFDHPLYDHTKD